MDEQQSATRAPDIGAGEYRLDPARSWIGFHTRHLFGLAPVRGSFGLVSGHVTVAEPLTSSAAVAIVDAASVHTGNAARDNMVRSSTYLDAGRHPEIRFSSQRLRLQDDGWQLDGMLTVRDRCRPVSLRVTRLAERDGELHACAATRIDRYEFGITAMKGMTGRYLDLRLELVAAPQRD